MTTGVMKNATFGRKFSSPLLKLASEGIVEQRSVDSNEFLSV